MEHKLRHIFTKDNIPRSWVMVMSWLLAALIANGLARTFFPSILFDEPLWRFIKFLAIIIPIGWALSYVITYFFISLGKLVDSLRR